MKTEDHFETMARLTKPRTLEININVFDVIDYLYQQANKEGELNNHDSSIALLNAGQHFINEAKKKNN